MLSQMSGVAHFTSKMLSCFSLSDDTVEILLILYMRLYTDDTTVLAESAAELQSAIHSVQQYCKEWYLSVNTNKNNGMLRHRTFVYDLLQTRTYIKRHRTFVYNITITKAGHCSATHTMIVVHTEQCTSGYFV